MLALVQNRVGSEPLWSYVMDGEQWICPFCANTVAKRQGHTQAESIARHLENCRHFANGRGAPQPKAVMEARLALGQLIQRCANEPAWRAFDADGTWISPYTLDRVPGVRVVRGQPDNFTYQAILAHLQAQPAGSEPHRPELVVLARDLHLRRAEVARYVAWQVATNPAWRWCDAQGNWRCPYTRRAVSGVPLTGGEAGEADWPTACQTIARYLITNCPTFATGALVMLPSERVAQAAGAGAVCLPPPSAESVSATPVNLERLLAGSSQFGLPVLGSTVHRTPLSSPTVGDPVESGRLFVRKDTTAIRLPLGSTPGSGGHLAVGAGAPQFPATPLSSPIQNTPSSGFPAPPLAMPVSRPPPPPLAVPPAPSSSAQTPPSRPLQTPLPMPSPLPGPKPVEPPPVAPGRLPGPSAAPIGEPPRSSPIFPLMAAFVTPPPLDPVEHTPRGSLPTSLPIPSARKPATSLPPVKFLSPIPEAAGDDGSLQRTSSLEWMDAAEPPKPPTARVGGNTVQVAQGRTLQERLLPQPPTVPGLGLATHHEPCHDISGDFYAFIPLPTGSLAIAIGDVSGHGVQAGLVMTMAKKTLEIYAAQGGTPIEVLGKVNDALAADLGGRLFISLVYAVVDVHGGTITWVRCGHPPMLRFNPVNDQEEALTPDGMVLGMASGDVFRASLTELVLPMEPGDTFLLYTDGLPETVNAQGEEFGQERLQAILRQCAVDGPQGLVQQVTDRVRHFRGPKPAADDCTVLVIQIE